MYRIAFIVFREFLEVGILFGIFVATTARISGAGRYVIAGIFLGLLAAAILAFFTNQISDSFHGLGNEYFDIGFIMLTVVVIVATLTWMRQNSAHIVNSLLPDKTGVSDEYDLDHDNSHKWVVTLIVSTTLFREASEVILMVHSIITTSHDSPADYLIGFGIGALGGLLCSIGVYFGMFKISTKHIFQVSTMLMSFIAAGLSAEAAKLLIDADVVGFLGNQLWDSSWIISDESIIGRVFKVIIGYQSRPCGLEILFYFSTLGVIYAINTVMSRRKMYKNR